MLSSLFSGKSTYQSRVFPCEATIGAFPHRRRVASVMKFNVKIHEIFLILIGIWMVHAWNEGILFAAPQPELLNRQTAVERSLGLSPNNIIPKIAKYALLYFVQFISDPFNLTLVMMCVFSRVVMNFLTICVYATRTKIWFDYEIDEKYFVPVDAFDQLALDDLV